MQEQLREEEKKLFNQTDTFENFADDSDGEVKEVKSRNPRIVGAMEASDSDTEVMIKCQHLFSALNCKQFVPYIFSMFYALQCTQLQVLST